VWYSSSRRIVNFHSRRWRLCGTIPWLVTIVVVMYVRTHVQNIQTTRLAIFMPYHLPKAKTYIPTASSMYAMRNPQAGPAINGSRAMVGFSRTSEHTLSNLSRWSIQNRSLPRPDTIKTVHVYDFDNTRNESFLLFTWHGETGS
jgi:hypothetical protein